MKEIVEILSDPGKRREFMIDAVIAYHTYNWQLCTRDDAALLLDTAMAAPEPKTCPFEAGGTGGADLDAEDPCPVCGDLGTFPKSGEPYTSKCVTK